MVGIIEESVCKAYNITAHELRSGGSKRLYSSARAMAWYILHYDYKWSSNAIAAEFGKTPRGVKSMIAKMKFLLQHDKNTKQLYDNIMKKGE